MMCLSLDPMVWASSPPCSPFQGEGSSDSTTEITRMAHLVKLSPVTANRTRFELDLNHNGSGRTPATSDKRYRYVRSEY